MPRSNVDMIHRLQIALNANGYRILCNRSQFYSEQMKTPITKYTISQSKEDPISGKSKHVTLFEAYSTIQIVLFMRNLWYYVNDRPIPETNKIKGAEVFERKWNEFLSKTNIPKIKDMKKVSNTSNPDILSAEDAAYNSDELAKVDLVEDVEGRKND